MTPPAAPLRNHDIADLRRLGVAHHLAAQQDWQAVEDPGGSRIFVRGEERSLGWIGAVEIGSEPGTNRRFGSGGIACIVMRDMWIAKGQMVRGVKDSIVMSPPLIIGAALDAAEPALRAL